MNLNYCIFRTEPIFTTSALAQIGAHNKREKKAYKSNPDIDISRSKDNIEIVPLTDKYVKGFYELTKEYKKQHDEKMKTERPDRQRTYKEMVDKSKNCVADEMIFTATHDFFNDMDEEEIKEWADTCMEFVYEDIGYSKEQVLHATVHMDEKTPHLHCVVVPLVKKFDKRSNMEKWTISKKYYMKDKLYLSELQDKYHERLISKGYELERGIKGSDVEHINIKDYKKITRKLEQNLIVRNDKLDQAMETFDNNMKKSKTIPFDKKHVVLEKDTLNSMNKVIDETKKIMELQPKLEQTFDELKNYTKSYNTLNNQNKKYEREIDMLRYREYQLEKENKRLQDYLKAILEAIKKFFRKMLKLGNEKTKEATASEIKAFYDNKKFDKDDIYDVSVKTTKEEELFDYADIPDYYKTKNKNYENKKDSFDISL